MTCRKCINSVYDDRLGQYRCKIYQHVIRDVDRYTDCDSHEPKNKKEKRKHER